MLTAFQFSQGQGVQGQIDGLILLEVMNVDKVGQSFGRFSSATFLAGLVVDASNLSLSYVGLEAVILSNFG